MEIFLLTLQIILTLTAVGQVGSQMSGLNLLCIYRVTVNVTGWNIFLQSSPLPFSAEAPLLRIWMARRMSRLKRATAAALSHSPSCSRDFRKGSTSISGPRLIQPQSCRARLRSSLWYRGTSVCLSEPDQQRRVSVVPEMRKTETFL